MKRGWLLACALAIAAHARGAPAGPDESSFRKVVRPMLQRAGCAGPTCHGGGLIALRLNPAGADDAHDYAEILRASRGRSPEASPLFRKATGIAHLGGENLDPRSCEARLLAAWLRGGRDLSACAGAAALPSVAEKDRLPPSLSAAMAGCAERACHGLGASPRLLDLGRPGGERVDLDALAPSLDRFLPSHSALLRKLLGEGSHPALWASPDAPGYRETHAWIAGEPVVRGPAPSREAFQRHVQPLLVRRGCTHPGCHGSDANAPTLLGRPDTAIDDYLRLVPRIAAGRFPQKPQNRLPHGGGRRLGGADDCAMATIGAWLDGTRPPTCTPRPPPDRARFIAVVQPSLEALTCPRCHVDERLGFRFVGHPDAADRERNYRAVLAKIDLDYPPASPVLLRVNEDCMQARLLAWVDRTADPGCTVDLAHFRGSFPRLPTDGNPGGAAR